MRESKNLSSKFSLTIKLILFIFSAFLSCITGCDCGEQINNSNLDPLYSDERIFLSTDAGETWEKQYPSKYGYQSIGYTYSSGGYKIIALSSGHDYIYTTDLGRNWKDTSFISSEFFYDLAFSPYDGVFSITTGKNTIFHSTDNCNTWSMQNAGASEKLHYIDFSVSSTLFQAAVGDYNDRIYLSTSGGNSWVYTVTGITGTERFTGIKYIRDNIIAAYGYDSLMLRSTDYGNSWSPQDLPGTASMLSLASNPESQSLFGGSNTAGKFFYSPDLGNTWELKEFTANTYRSRIFSISYNGIIIGAGENGELLKSTDNGMTWRKITMATDKNFQDVVFINNSLVVAVCSY